MVRESQRQMVFVFVYNLHWYAEEQIEFSFKEMVPKSYFYPPIANTVY